MSKRIVIGGLDLYRGEDVLRFNGSSDYVDLPTDHGSFDVEFTCKFTPETSAPTYQTLLGKKDKWAIYIISQGKVQFFVRRGDGGGDWHFNASTNSYVVGQENTVECCIDSSNNLSYIILNGVRTDFTGQIYNTTIYSNFMYMGAVNSASGTARDLWFKGDMRNVVVDGSEYVNNGDFGSPTLIDHSGNGNDGTINGATWWKKGVDENYLTRTAYTGSWPIPMEESHEVIVVDPAEYLPTANAAWNPYNVDLTYDFNVSLQQLRHALPGTRLTLNMHLNL